MTMRHAPNKRIKLARRRADVVTRSRHARSLCAVRWADQRERARRGGTVNTRRASIAIVLLVWLAAAGAVVLAGCGSRGPHLPDVAIGVNLGPKHGEATIDVRSRGSGLGFGEMLVTYPNGHRHGGWRGLLQDGAGWAPILRSLRPGRYEYTLYAEAGPLTSRTLASLHALKKQDIVASGSFWIE